MQEKYNLTWPSYSDHLKNMMKELMMNEDFSDVTLVTEDKKQFKANIHILTACSPVFKTILKKDKNSSPIMYLRGIQYTELESIMQFIYLGEATFHEERMDEFLSVAKSLEIKELCNDETELLNDGPNDEPPPCVPVTSTKNLKGEAVISDQMKMQAPKESVISVSRNYECDQCHKIYSGSGEFNRHKQSAHKGVKYACDQCDYQATQKSDLTKHIQSKHEGVKYACHQCDQQFTLQRSLTKHIQSKHEGVRYACDQCDYQATQKSDLTKHSESKHEGLKYACDQCDQQFTSQRSLTKHIQTKH